MDECLPPIVRDSYWFMYPFFFVLYKGRDIYRKMHFKSLAYTMSENELNNFYKEVNAISRNRKTDLSESNIKYIIENIPGDTKTIVDIGCGKGFLLDRIHKVRSEAVLFGLDIENQLKYPGIHFIKGSINHLPFPDNHFDVVLCSHTIEHIIQLSEAIKELVRVTRNRLIVVTPCQRYFYYTIDGHLHFFHKAGPLLHHFPLKNLQCKKLNMDWICIGDK
jgi:ubiquinone/menaquinone biosynthesis C-methylase UbiE